MPVGGNEGVASTPDLRRQRERLAEERRQKARKEAEEKMLMHWKLNNPDFRQLQMKKHQEMVQKAWDAQRVEQQARREQERREEDERRRHESAAAEEQEKAAREEDERRRKKVMEWKKSLLEQIEGVKERERTEAAMNERIRAELEKQRRIEEVEETRKRTEERRKREDLNHYLHRQHRLKLLAKASQVKKELEEDQRLLDEIAKVQEAKEETDERRRDEKRREILWMRRVLEEQKAEEAKRAKQMELMFSEEAEGFWSRQDRIWREEKAARKKLMDDVIAGWREQVKERLQRK